LCLSDLLQRLRTRENEQRRQQQQRSRSNRDGRKSLSYDAAPFNIQNAPSLSLHDQSVSISGAIPTDATSGASSSISGTDLSLQRRQLGERLYPKVHVIQPV
jgi:hypothetical protein